MEGGEKTGSQEKSTAGVNEEISKESSGAPHSDPDDKISKVGIIRKLDEIVVNRIAAGEVVQRPANALKELLENSLDAGAKTITITVKSGGLKLLQIQDDGSGIRKEDLTIVCERFTTSKLEKFEDLQTIATYGFRGEALASISHVAHLSILTKTEDSQCAYKAEYTDGGLSLTDPSVSNPKACAGKQGTTIIVEDLFFNMETRRRALKAASEEHNKIVDVVTRYAVHNPKIGFSVKKQGELNNELRTPPKSSHLDNIRILFGNEIARELIPVSCEDKTCNFSMSGFVSNANYSVKKPTFLLFINHRLVESSALKKGIDSVYTAYLPKGSHPFLYLSLEIDPRNVDVNVHPTKYEVHFLHEDLIISGATNAVEKVLLGSNQSRTFFVQSLLPGASGASTSTAIGINRKRKEESAASSSSQKFFDPFTAQVVVQPKNMVRTDPKLQKLDKFLTSTPNPGQKEFASFQDSPSRLMNMSAMSGVSNPTFRRESEVGTTTREMVNEPIPGPSTSKKDEELSEEAERGSGNVLAQSPVGTKGSIITTTQRREIRLKSVKNLRSIIERDTHSRILEVFRNLTFVASIDRNLALIQHETKLYLLNTYRISVEMFYQKLIYEFGNFGRISIEEPIYIHELVAAALENHDSGFCEEPVNPDLTAIQIQALLLSKSTMLDDYFSLKFDGNGRLISIPLLLENYFPCMEGIPKYLVDIATKVNWTSEQKCFETFCHQTALFYAIQSMDDQESMEEITLNGKSWKWTIEHVFYPEVRKSFLPPKAFAEDSTIVMIANLPDLYKVFERC